MSRTDRTPLRIADLQVDPALDEIRKDGQTLKLEPKAMQLLVCLAERAGEVVSVEELLDRVWKDVVVSQDSVYAAVAALRRILGDDPKNPTYIANVVRRGYRLVAPVSLGTSESPSPAPASTSTPPPSGKPAILVLPFLNLSADPALDPIIDGITEDIITELSRWRRLAVRSRSASFRLRGATIDTRQIAQELNADFLIEGSVRRMHERIRVGVQVSDTATGSPIWSEKFDRAAEDILAVQDLLVQTLVSTLVGRVEALHTERARRKPSSSLAAYDCVLQCNALSWDDPAGFAEAKRLIEKAVTLDPGYAFAYALLAELTYSRWSDGPAGSTAALDQAYALAMRAVELDDGDSTCQSTMGNMCLQRRAYDLAVQYAQRAVDLNPNNPSNVADLGVTLLYVGEAEKSLEWLARARAIDAYFDQPWYWRTAGMALMNLERYAEALVRLGRIRVRAYQYFALIAGCQARLGNAADARAAATECLALRPEFSISQLIAREPFKLPADAERLATSLRMAGLPE